VVVENPSYFAEEAFRLTVVAGVEFSVVAARRISLMKSFLPHRFLFQVVASTGSTC
jgi:hypothetical protein